MIEEKGLKFDDGKVRLDLIDYKFVEGIGLVLTYGAKKYAENNWKLFTPDDRKRLRAAALRHLHAYCDGERFDKETGLSHLYHAGCELMFLDYFDRMVDAQKKAEEEEEQRANAEAFSIAFFPDSDLTDRH